MSSIGREFDVRWSNRATGGGPGGCARIVDRAPTAVSARRADRHRRVVPPTGAGGPEARGPDAGRAPEATTAGRRGPRHGVGGDQGGGDGDQPPATRVDGAAAAAAGRGRHRPGRRRRKVTSAADHASRWPPRPPVAAGPGTERPPARSPARAVPERPKIGDSRPARPR